MSETDPLFDSSEPAMRERLERFKTRLNAPPPVPVESPLQRAIWSLGCAVEDLNVALWTAQSPEELAQVLDVAEQTINRLTVTCSVLMAITEHLS